MNKKSAVFACLLLSATLARSQDQPAPKAPLVHAAPPGSQWTMKISRSDSNPDRAKADEGKGDRQTSALPERLEMQIGQNQIRRGVITLSNGQKEEFYQLKNFTLQKCANSERIARSAAREDPTDPLSLRSPSFPGIIWVSEKNHAGTETLGKKMCHKFHVARGGKNLPYVLEADYSADEMTAWIDTGTRYPVRVQIGEVTYDFSEVTLHRQDIQPAGGYAAALKKISSSK